MSLPRHSRILSSLGDLIRNIQAMGVHPPQPVEAEVEPEVLDAAMPEAMPLYDGSALEALRESTRSLPEGAAALQTAGASTEEADKTGARPTDLPGLRCITVDQPPAPAARSLLPVPGRSPKARRRHPATERDAADEEVYTLSKAAAARAGTATIHCVVDNPTTTEERLDQVSRTIEPEPSKHSPPSSRRRPEAAMTE